MWEISGSRWSGFGGMQNKFDSIIPPRKQEVIV